MIEFKQHTLYQPDISEFTKYQIESGFNNYYMCSKCSFIFYWPRLNDLSSCYLSNSNIYKFTSLNNLNSSARSYFEKLDCNELILRSILE
jgi:hypothetical protein